MNGRTYTMSGEKPVLPISAPHQPTNIVSNRVEIMDGGVSSCGGLVMVNMKIKAKTTNSGSPSLMGQFPNPITEAALSCIDITQGIGDAIDGAIPCGVSTIGALYLKSITTDHIYAITGCYISA